MKRGAAVPPDREARPGCTDCRPSAFTQIDTAPSMRAPRGRNELHSGVLVTGATGFLGSHLALQFLKGSDHDAVVCLARRSREQSACERVLQALRNAEHDAGG